MPDSNSAPQFDDEPSPSFVLSNALKLAYDEFGNENDPAIVLIMGLGTQMIAWPDTFCQGLADCGFRVIRFDNRDIGLSEKIHVDEIVSIPRILLFSRLGMSVSVPYKLLDMAEDAVGVLDALNIDSAHFVGASMGGMIAQLIAAHFPDRCATLTSIMSTTGNPNLKKVSWRVSRQMLSRPTSGKPEALLEHGMNTWRIIGSPDFMPSDEDLRERITRSLRRSFYPRGYLHHMAAILESGDRRDIIKEIEAPTLVIHGKEDVLIPVDGGIDTANHIEGADLQLIEGMGHDLPTELLPRFVRMIERHINDA